MGVVGPTGPGYCLWLWATLWERGLHAVFLSCFLKSFAFLFFFFFFGCPLAYGVPRPGIRSQPQLQPSPSAAMLDLLTYCVELGMDPVSWCCRDTPHTIVPPQELPLLSFDKYRISFPTHLFSIITRYTCTIFRARHIIITLRNQ